MAIHHFRRTSCRLCGAADLTSVLTLRPTPLANAFVKPEEAGADQPRFPLELFLCSRCKHAQLLDVVDPKALYEHYVYVSGTSPVFVQHFKHYADEMLARYAPGDHPSGAFVVDIGSNDGTLLAAFQERGARVLGVDPAQEIARGAVARGIETIIDFFTPSVARDIVDAHGNAAIVTANNVFAHVDDLASFTDGVRHLIGGDGVFAFEVSYLRDVLDKTLFDTIYHEHLDYHLVAPLEQFFAARGMELIDAVRIDTHGGSLRGIAQAKGGPHAALPSVKALIAEEHALGLHEAPAYQAFSEHIDRVGAELRQVLADARAAGKRIAGYGAPAKATTLMVHFGIDASAIEYIVDDSPWKQGLLSPGLHIPIVSSQHLKANRPDYLLLLAWNFAQPIMKNNAWFHDAGGKFIVPLPHVSIQ
jgi:SAM-dependent methyltransferase